MAAYAEIIDFITTHREEIVREPRKYVNMLTFAFDQKLFPFADYPEFFVPMRLHVFRLPQDFVDAQKTQLDDLYKETLAPDDEGYQDVWLTTSWLKTQHLLMVELSYE
ncbi:hypothetical protein [Schleiferilactobacillus shenzhenensis]|uniref:Uncharacterized protein n=1 Tax=Schleiferilactobacillus shenzhenensis LY-73 TaxID=1231336 RepID=U4TSJ2_9LACO|nr:hypothetical protein [Schleiferilactobacillus shenzhenensis]ERL66395.1 hypothetical protein L248_0074 [Schleiferilactobacillus shenzhenensis LY-73]